jgi:hypothetical protein
MSARESRSLLLTIFGGIIAPAVCVFELIRNGQFGSTGIERRAIAQRRDHVG